MGEIEIRNVQRSQLDRKTGRLTSYDQFWVQEGSGEPKTYEGEFTIQLYKAGELREMLARNGFETVSQDGFDGSDRILTVARKRR